MVMFIGAIICSFGHNTWWLTNWLGWKPAISSKSQHQTLVFKGVGIEVFTSACSPLMLTPCPENWHITCFCFSQILKNFKQKQPNMSVLVCALTLLCYIKFPICGDQKKLKAGRSGRQAQRSQCAFEGRWVALLPAPQHHGSCALGNLRFLTF